MRLCVYAFQKYEGGYALGRAPRALASTNPYYQIASPHVDMTPRTSEIHKKVVLFGYRIYYWSK